MTDVGICWCWCNFRHAGTRSRVESPLQHPIFPWPLSHPGWTERLKAFQGFVNAKWWHKDWPFSLTVAWQSLNFNRIRTSPFQENNLLRSLSKKQYRALKINVWNCSRWRSCRLAPNWSCSLANWHFAVVSCLLDPCTTRSPCAVPSIGYTYIQRR